MQLDISLKRNKLLVIRVTLSPNSYTCIHRHLSFAVCMCSGYLSFKAMHTAKDGNSRHLCMQVGVRTQSEYLFLFKEWNLTMEYQVA